MIEKLIKDVPNSPNIKLFVANLKGPSRVGGFKGGGSRLPLSKEPQGTRGSTVVFPSRGAVAAFRLLSLVALVLCASEVWTLQLGERTLVQDPLAAGPIKFANLRR